MVAYFRLSNFGPYSDLRDWPAVLTNSLNGKVKKSCAERAVRYSQMRQDFAANHKKFVSFFTYKKVKVVAKNPARRSCDSIIGIRMVSPTCVKEIASKLYSQNCSIAVPPTNQVFVSIIKETPADGQQLEHTWCNCYVNLQVFEKIRLLDVGICGQQIK